jgi:hypothetical protein
MGRKQEYVNAPAGDTAPPGPPVVMVAVFLAGAVLCALGALVV